MILVGAMTCGPMIDRIQLLSFASIAAFALTTCSPPPAPSCASTCAGCCTAAGKCELGSQLGACGAPGATCVSCTAGQTCNRNGCVEGITDAGPDDSLDAGPIDGGRPNPRYLVLPATQAFAACPTSDAMGSQAVDVYPDLRRFKVRNVGTANGTFTLSVTGAGAGAFAADGGSTLAPDAGAIVEVWFSPADAGSYSASLEVADAFASIPVARATLVGTAHPFPSRPIVSAAILNAAAVYVDCQPGQSCEQRFAGTLFGETTTVDLKLSNLGCPSLKITGLEVLPAPGASAELAYFIDAPAIPPTSAAPLVLTVSEDRQTLKVKLRFAPMDDGSGELNRLGILRLKTNDSNARDANNNSGGFDVLLRGTALKPSVYATLNRCEFSDPSDLCGNATKVINKANLMVKNAGNAAITIDSVVFKSNGNPTTTRFAVGASIAGMMIAPAGSLPLEVNYTALPLYTQDQLIISASVSVQPVGSAGRAILTLGGGNRPCLSTVPTLLDFANPSDPVTAKVVTIRNGIGCGALQINSVAIDPNPFFTLVPPRIQAGSMIAAGASVDATVEYQQPISRGAQLGLLRIQSNDADFPTPAGLKVHLYSQTPVDQLPVGMLKGCLPSDTACAQGMSGTMSVSLASLPAGPNGTRLLTMFGSDSFDPPGTMTQASQFRFRLVSKPANASNAVLENDSLKTVKSAVSLGLDGAATGLYRITLDVWDATNQQSPVPTELRINAGL